MNIFLDTNDLIALAKSGTAADPFLGLNSLLATGDKLILTDTIKEEATSGNFPDATVIQDWLTANSNSITKYTSGIAAGSSNAGENSIVQAINSPEFNGQPYEILSGDTGFNWSANGINTDNVQSAVQLLNGLLKNGNVSLENYISIRDSMQANAPTTSFIDQLKSDAEAFNTTPFARSEGFISDSSGNITQTGTPLKFSLTDVLGKFAGDESGSFDITGVLNSLGTVPEINSVIGHLSIASVETLGIVGVLAIIGDIQHSVTTALTQINNGDFNGAAETIGALAGRIGLGIAGAETGALLGAGVAEALVGAGLIASGGGAALAAAALGAVAVSILGATVGNNVGAKLGVAATNAIGDLLNAAIKAFPDAKTLLTGGWTSSLNNFLFATQGAFNAFWTNQFGAAAIRISPIVLDLTGNGVQTTPQSAGTYFDLRNTGFAQSTGWVAPQDGLLVWDRNGNGVIDNGGELFGNYTQKADGTTASNGFAALASYDDNHDGKIDANDAVWSNLKIWTDTNGNGVTDPGELHALSDFNIQSLNLGFTDQGASVTDAAGNHPEFVGSYTLANGTTRTMTDVFFASDPSQTVPTSFVATTPAIDALPDAPGMGTLYSLHQAMARDTSGTLQALVSDFAANTSVSGRDADLENILLTWAGAENIDPNSRNSNGSSFDARHLAVLEQAMGRPFVTTGNNGLPTSDPIPFMDTRLNASYFFLSERVYAELAAQTFLKPFYDEIATVSDSSGTHFDFTAALADLFGNTRPAATQQTLVEEFYRTVFASGVLDAQVNYAGLLSALAAQAPQYAAAVNTIVAPYFASNLIPVPDTTGGLLSLAVSADNSTIVGGLGGNTIFANEDLNGLGNFRNTTVYANAGTNRIFANPLGADKIFGGTGDDTVSDSGALAAGTIIDGGTGNNTFDLVNTTSDISQAAISRIQTLKAGGATVTMTADQLSGFSTIDASTGFGGVTINTASDGTYSLRTQNIIGNVRLSAAFTNNNVTLIGNDQAGLTLVAGTGVDTLIGGLGGDTFIANSGLAAGSSVIGQGNNNVLQAFGDISGATVTGVQTLNVQSSVKLSAGEFAGFSAVAASGGTATIFAATGGTYSLAGKTVSGQVAMTATSANGTTLIGNDADNQSLTASATGNDTLIAGNGAGDVLRGGSGIDTMIGGLGGDTFNTFAGLAAGSSITGHGSHNIIQALGDISQIAITGVQELDVLNSATLTASQFAGFSTINAAFTGTGNILAATGGTYSLAGKTVVGQINLTAASAANTTLIGNNANNQTLTGGGGTDILQAGNGQGDVLRAGSGTTTLIAGRGVDTLIGGSGNDTFKLASSLFGTPVAGTTVIGGSGTNTLVANGDITGVNISGVQNFQTLSATMTGAQFNGFNSLKAQFGTSGSITLTSGGAYSLIGKTTDAFNLTAQSNAGTTLIGNDASYESLTASNTGNDTLTGGNGDFLTLSAGYGTGNDTLTVGNGQGDILIANNGNDTLIAGNGGAQLQAGSGVDTLIGGSGNDTFVTGNGLAAGSSIQGNGGADTLIGFGDISQATITGVQTLQTTSIELTQAQLDAFTAVTGFGFGGQITAATAGVYSLVGKSTSAFDMIAGSNGGTTLIGNNADGESLIASATGNDTLTAGNGNNDILNAGGGNDILNGGSGYDSYRFGSSFGQDVIHNAGGSAAKGEVDFTSSSVTDEKLWFQRSGNDLQVDLLGTNSQITVANWFGSPGAQVQSFNTADGLKLDSQVAQLVSAMASYAANNPGFNPTTATQMPTDTTLQTAIAAAWHH